MTRQVSYDDKFLEAIESYYWQLNSKTLELGKAMDAALDRAEDAKDELKILMDSLESVEGFLWKNGINVHAPVVITEKELIEAIMGEGK